MTASFSDYNKTVQNGEALLRNINQSIHNTQVLRHTTKAEYGVWRNVAVKKKARKSAAPAGDSGAGSMMETMFMSFLMQSLFGLPVFQSLGFDAETVKGLGLAGGAMHREIAGGAQAKTPQTHVQFKAINRALINAQKIRAEHALGGQADRLDTLASMKKAVMLLLMTMLLQKEEQSGESGKGTGDMVAPDALRPFRLGQFKQNRHSMACVRTMFEDQAQIVTYTPPRHPQLRCV